VGCQTRGPAGVGRGKEGGRERERTQSLGSVDKGLSDSLDLEDGGSLDVVPVWMMKKRRIGVRRCPGKGGRRF